MILFFSLCWSLPLFAQEEVAAEEVSQDDLGNVSDEFKENFFDALAAKAIGNHDKAIAYLKVCDRIQPNSGAIQFELAKNHLMDRNFQQAEDYLKKAVQLEGQKEPLLETLYDIYDQQQDYERSIIVLEQLAAQNENYEELLPFQYFRLERFDDAVAMIQKLDDRLGEDPRRNYIQRQIAARSRQNERESSSIDQLQQRIADNPQDEQAYVNLLYIYSQQGKTDEVVATAQAMETALPSSDKVHLALYKIYLDQGEIEKAVTSMERVFGSSEFDLETKTNVLQDFIKTGSTDPTVAGRIEEAIDDFADEVEDVRTYQILGDFYLSQKQPQQAITFYEKGLEEAPKNYELIKNIILLSIDIKDYQNAVDRTEEALDVFPAQALLYLLSGVAHNQLGQAQKAIDQLEMGLSFLLDEPKLESDIYQQLAVSHDQLGNTTKAAKMRSKVAELSKKIQ